MGQFLGFGNGSDGIATLSGTDAPIDSSCSGIAAATSLSATNASFAAGQIILIHQSRGTGVGQWEINQIASYVAGTITTVLPLTYTYTDSGASQAQVLVLKQYSSVTVSGTFTAKAWDGNVGGILAFLCNGEVTVTGTISANEKGYRGGIAVSGADQNGYQGEGSAGAGSQDVHTRNGSGGGAGGMGSPGAGGAHSADVVTNANGVEGGNAVGTADLTTMLFGGAGGSGGTGSGGGTSGVGGSSGGIIFIISKRIIVTGLTISNGGIGADATNAGAGGGGGSSGGAIFLKGQTIEFGTNLITATAGAGSGWQGKPKSDGSDGRIRVETCSLVGTSNPSASESVGGHNFCSVGGGIFSE